MTESREIRDPTQRASHTQDEISLLDLINILLRRWQLVVGLPMAAAVVTAVFSLVIPPTFTASTAFVPELGSQGQLPGGLAGLAGQFGIALPSQAGQTAQFYAEVVKSQEIMNRILLSEFADPRPPHNSSDSTRLLALLDVTGDSLADSLHRARQKLDDLVSARVDNQTNIVTLSVDSHYPVLAAAVANRLIEYLNEFNAETRQSQSRERRRFVEARLAEAEQELQDAEEAIRQFYQRNRTWEQSPQLTFGRERLQRQVQARLEVVLTLRREYETARIGEVNDTPVITIINSATPPQQRSRPRRKLLVILTFLLGGTLSVFGAFGLELMHRAKRTDQSTYAEFRDAIKQIQHDLRRLVWNSSRRSQENGL